jgi:hypothetical protein
MYSLLIIQDFHDIRFEHHWMIESETSWNNRSVKPQLGDIFRKQSYNIPASYTNSGHDKDLSLLKGPEHRTYT